MCTSLHDALWETLSVLHLNATKKWHYPYTVQKLGSHLGPSMTCTFGQNLLSEAEDSHHEKINLQMLIK